MQILFIPVVSDNPYQNALANSLAKHDTWVSFVSNLKKFFTQSNNIQPDVIHLHWLPFVARGYSGYSRVLLFLIRLWIARRRNIKIVWTAHNLRSHEAVSVFAERLQTWGVLRLSSKVIVHSSFAARTVCEDFGEKFAEKVEVIPHGSYVGIYENHVTKEEARTALAIPQGALVYLFFGNLRPYKGIEELLSSFRKLEDENAILLVAGSPVNQAYASKIRAHAEQDHRVRLDLTVIPDNEIQNFMNAADIAVFPYRNILTSGALLLAMSYSRPCIAPLIGPIPETIDHKTGGFLYDPANDEALYQALLQASEQSHELSQMGDYNFRSAQKLNWEEIGRETSALYQKIV